MDHFGRGERGAQRRSAVLFGGRPTVFYPDRMGCIRFPNEDGHGGPFVFRKWAGRGMVVIRSYPDRGDLNGKGHPYEIPTQDGVKVVP